MLMKDGKVTMTEAEYQELINDSVGLCTECGAERSCTEPDAENYDCAACGKDSVYGVEQLLLAGKVVLNG